MTKPSKPAPKTSPVRQRANGVGNITVGRGTSRVLLGQEDLTDWDDEELLRGQRRASDGSFRGKPPKVIPRYIHDEWRRRTFSKAQEDLVKGAPEAVKVLLDICESPLAEDRDKISAAKIVLDRVFGKAPEKINVNVEQPKWVQALTTAIVPGDDEGEEVIDAISWETG